jgi:hypothetical protein
VFCTSTWAASAAAAADWSLVAGEDVSAAAVASALPSLRFSCATGGPFPGVSTRTSTFVFPTPFCCPFALASAPCAIDAPCSASLCPGAASLFPGPGSLCPGAPSLFPGAGSLCRGAASLLPGPGAAWARAASPPPAAAVAISGPLPLGAASDLPGASLGVATAAEAWSVPVAGLADAAAGVVSVASAAAVAPSSARSAGAATSAAATATTPRSATRSPLAVHVTDSGTTPPVATALPRRRDVLGARVETRAAHFYPRIRHSWRHSPCWTKKLLRRKFPTTR